MNVNLSCIIWNVNSIFLHFFFIFVRIFRTFRFTERSLSLSLQSTYFAAGLFNKYWLNGSYFENSNTTKKVLRLFPLVDLFFCLRLLFFFTLSFSIHISIVVTQIFWPPCTTRIVKCMMVAYACDEE